MGWEDAKRDAASAERRAEEALRADQELWDAERAAAYEAAAHAVPGFEAAVAEFIAKMPADAFSDGQYYDVREVRGRWGRRESLRPIQLLCTSRGSSGTTDWARIWRDGHVDFTGLTGLPDRSVYGRGTMARLTNGDPRCSVSVMETVMGGMARELARRGLL